MFPRMAALVSTPGVSYGYSGCYVVAFISSVVLRVTVLEGKPSVLLESSAVFIIFYVAFAV